MAKPAKKASLGRGLSSLLGPDLIVNQDKTDNYSEKTDQMPILQLRPGKYQPRSEFKDDEIKELSESIKEIGILQPILVRKSENNYYEIIAGERRWRAAKKIGLSEVPVIVKDFDDKKASEAALIENIQRDDLNPIEEAVAYQIIIDNFSFTQEQLSKKIGKSRSHVTNMLRLIKLPESIKSLIKNGKITAGHARVLLKCDNPEKLAQEIIDNNLNVRDIEKINKKTKKSTINKKSSYKTKDEDIKHLEEQITNHLNLSTEILLDKESGKVILSFNTLQELDNLIGTLCKKI